ncbi:hypothetical protein HXX76_002626 [Chlamydomonas incerta]|uniref:Uncharacterized protein n=1 Tax=Chlamydomonas incerta TaxID=51695 RepID=A0A835W7Q3_CHLIN|nr:hypothetical protein HXX76_002626 [Chlamydomonas incerta]|eukprot:KAG2442540.1 hypothetical protein HXX76_002626 [Chlamydomonas incerta]
MLDENLQATANQQQPQAGSRQSARPDPKAAAGRASTLANAAATAARPINVASDVARPTDGEFPYNTLGEAVLDGSLSSALAQAKAAAQAAANASGAAFSGPASAAGGRRGSSRRGGLTVTSAAAAAAVAAAAGGDSVAADVLAELVATNPRASSSDLRSLLSQRLQDRSVLLDNPMAALNAKKMFARRTSSYSAQLRSNTQIKKRTAASLSAADGPAAEQAAAAGPRKGAPSFETMLRVHELWNQYTQGLIRNAPAASSTAAAAAAAAKVADLHGARVTVVQHRNPQLVGTSGVVLRKSSAALHLVTPGDRVKVVPLKGCAAQYTINGIVLQLTG